MLYGLTILPEHVAIVVLAAIVAAAVVAYFLRKDSAIDERQEMCSKAASVLSKWELRRLAEIMHSVAAINVDATIQKIRSLVDEVGAADNEEPMFALLGPNFYYSLVKRVKRQEDREKILEEVIKDPWCRAKMLELLEELGEVVEELEAT